MRTVLLALILGVSFIAFTPVLADDVIWNFEEGNDHGFALRSANPALAAPDDPATAGDEAVTGVGGARGLPAAGVAWTIGRPDQFDGFRPAFDEGDKVKADGTMEYNQPGTNHPFAFPTNGRGQESYLSTYNLTQWGDNVHTEQNDQIATSPLVLLGDGAVLTVWAHGGGSGTSAPALDATGYTTGSAGVAVLSAADGSLLESVLTDGHGTLREDTIDLSAYAGQKVYVEVVDAFDGSWGWLAVDEVRITNAISLGGNPEQAANPNPPDEATDVPVDVVLSWTPGEYAPAVSGHRVYLSANFDDVNEALAQASQAITSDPEFDTADLSFALDFGTTYYWRIDEANDVTGWDEGKVWSFTTEPFAYPIEQIVATASSSHKAETGPENTIDGSGLDGDLHSTKDTDMWLSSASGAQPTWIQYEFDEAYKLYELWVWNYNVGFESILGFGFREVTIEHSIDGATWSTLEGVPEFAEGSSEEGYAPNTIVDFGGVVARYVRLTANSNFKGLGQYGLSEVRFLYIPVTAREPSPASGATGVAPDVVLDWRPGREAVVHDVYLDTSEQAVADGTADVVSVATSSYAATGLELGKTYFWRVDEVNDAGVPPIWEGDVWNFKTLDYLVVDDFETYNDDWENYNRIFQVWIDGAGYTTPEPGNPGNGSGALVGTSAAPWVERTIVHGGRQSMPLSYNNATVAISEATRTLPGEDWTAGGIKSLSLWFYGDPDNTGQLYVKINNAEVRYDGGADDIKRGQWLPWNIDLSDPAIGGNASNVTSLTVGVRGAGAKGMLYIDDIRLYPKMPELLTPVEPAKTGLLAEYLFDNGANDTSGKGHHGTFLGDAYVANSRLFLDGTDDAVFIPRLGGATATHANCTYSMWMYSDTEPPNPGFIGGINYDNWAEGGGIHCKIRNAVANVGVSGVPGGDLNGTTIVGSDEWFHLGLTVTDDEVTLFLNGQVEDSRSFTGPVEMVLGRGCIGAYRDNNVIERELRGQMDDVRIYNRVVSLEEMLWLAGRQEPAHKPF